MQGNTMQSASMLDYSLYLQQGIGETDHKESSQPNPMVEPLPRTISLYDDDMGRVVFFIVVMDFSQSPGFICNFPCTGAVLLLSSRILPRSSTAPQLRLAFPHKPCRYLQSILSDLSWIHLSLLKDKHGLPGVDTMPEKKGNNQAQNRTRLIQRRMIQCQFG